MSWIAIYFTEESSSTGIVWLQTTTPVDGLPFWPAAKLVNHFTGAVFRICKFVRLKVDFPISKYNQSSIFNGFFYSWVLKRRRYVRVNVRDLSVNESLASWTVRHFPLKWKDTITRPIYALGNRGHGRAEAAQRGFRNSVFLGRVGVKWNPESNASMV